jgi:hypothetical protein
MADARNIGGELPPGVQDALAPLVVDPGSTAVLTDFDGTISPIVENPH